MILQRQCTKNSSRAGARGFTRKKSPHALSEVCTKQPELREQGSRSFSALLRIQYQPLSVRFCHRRGRASRILHAPQGAGSVLARHPPPRGVRAHFLLKPRQLNRHHTHMVPHKQPTAPPSEHPRERGYDGCDGLVRCTHAI